MIHYRLHSLKDWTMNSRGFSNPWNEGGPFSSHQPERLNLVNGNVQSFRLFRACESSTPEAWKPPANKEVQPFRLVNTFRVLCGEQVINSVSLCSIIKNLRHRRNLRMKNIKTQWNSVYSVVKINQHAIIHTEKNYVYAVANFKKIISLQIEVTKKV